MYICHVRVFNPFAQSHSKSTLAQCYRKNEQKKKRAYNERVREVERGSFSQCFFPPWAVWDQSPSLCIDVLPQ